MVSPIPPSRVVVAMSGGVDSSVTAALLRERGHDVVGLFMRNGVEHATRSSRQGCCSAADAQDARRVADRLGIPFYALDFSAEFRTVVDRFVAEYARGRTPNPCIECNQALKFGRLLDYADAVGATHVATGHYARLENGVLRRGHDRAKDQSYVLFALSPAQIARTLLPIGALSKDEVRAEARRFDLPVSAKPESMEICFVPDNDYRRLIRERAAPRPGPMVDMERRLLAEHPGIENFTVGQREGLGIALGRPAYVVALEPETNTVVVGFADDLLSRGLVARRVNWLGGAPAGTLDADVQIRAHHRPAAATLTLDGDAVHVAFREPVRAVTPGQAAVFYRGDDVLGGGWIERGIPA
ncbi:MAG: tRNA 2-thiouridine(34) synthase MnmA [Candidatus Brocadiae bacterium]|nr:tRNA 2-thiouridine(34) synthase MnmA [Candidatus Brocadiia bacterium]